MRLCVYVCKNDEFCADEEEDSEKSEKSERTEWVSRSQRKDSELRVAREREREESESRVASLAIKKIVWNVTL